jgi:hypothetical protein
MGSNTNSVTDSVRGLVTSCVNCKHYLTRDSVNCKRYLIWHEAAEAFPLTPINKAMCSRGGVFDAIFCASKST